MDILQAFYVIAGCCTEYSKYVMSAKDQKSMYFLGVTMSKNSTNLFLLAHPSVSVSISWHLYFYVPVCT